MLRLADGVYVAVEALVRWRHPTRGLMVPSDFLPAAERTGAIIKLDRSFIAGDDARDADIAVIGAIVTMAGRLGLRVVAEGVERVDQQRFLERMGADAAQGYLYRRPAPAAEFGEWLAASPAADRVATY